MEKLEKILGGKIERRDNRTIPGVAEIAGREVIYFSDDASGKPRRAQLQKLTRQINPPLLKSGGSSELGCTIRPPGGIPFHAIAYHGDIEGWRKQIGMGAYELGLLTARIVDDAFSLSDGRSFPLVECSIEFD